MSSKAKYDPRIKILVGVILFCIIKGPFNHLLSFLLVTPIMSKIEPDLAMDIASSVVTIGFLYWFVQHRKAFKINTNHLWISVCICFLYLAFYRFDNDWYFYSFFNIHNFYYTDLLISIPSLGIIILDIGNRVVNKNNKESRRDIRSDKTGDNGFLEDNPLTDNEPDLLGLSPYAEKLASKISATMPKKAFAIGVNGEWGSGKTSFVDILTGYLDNTKFKLFHFNPWNSSTPRAIIDDFFTGFQDVLQEENPRIARKLWQYGTRLIELSDSAGPKMFFFSFKYLFGSESVDSLHKELGRELASLDKRIIVIIDDLDRSDEGEVFEVLRLIRNTANFPNLFYLVAYDREYMVNAIGSRNEYGKVRFLDKIFQIEVNLPKPDKSVFGLVLEEQLKKCLPQDASELITEHFSDNGLGSNLNIQANLDSIREVKRLVNSFETNYSSLLGEVDFADFLQIELFRIKYPRLYSLLRDSPGKYLNVSKGGTIESGAIYFLAASKLVDTNTDFQNSAPEEPEETLIYSEFKTHYGDYSWLRDAINHLNQIFGASVGFDLGSFVSEFSIRRPEFFRNYFTYKLLPGQISQVEFEIAKSAGLDNLKAFIDQAIDERLDFQICRKFKIENEFEFRDDFELTIKAIFYLVL